MIVRFFFALSAATGGLQASPVPPDSTSAIVVTGHIVDDRTGHVIDAASITMPQWLLSAKTDSLGQFTLRGVPAGHVVVQVDRVGFVTRLFSITVAATDTADSLHIALSSVGRARPACTPLAKNIPLKEMAVAKPYIFGRPRTVPAGALVQLYAWTTPETLDSSVAAVGTLGGELVNMVRASRGKFIGVGAVPVDSEFPVMMNVVVTYASGERRSVDAEIPIIPAPKPPRHKTPPKKPTSSGPSLDTATLDRISAETDLPDAIAGRSVATPSLWNQPFIRPKKSPITSPVTTRTLGVEFKGADGDSIVAVNRGVVALVVDLYFGGTAIYIDHGGGLISGYLHLGQVFVSPGDTVARGQVIATVGHTGHVIAPHFVWSMRLNDIPVNPLTALDLVPIPSIPAVTLCRPE